MRSKILLLLTLSALTNAWPTTMKTQVRNEMKLKEKKKTFKRDKWE
jgi:hypothetical protein